MIHLYKTIVFIALLSLICAHKGKDETAETVQEVHNPQEGKNVFLIHTNLNKEQITQLLDTAVEDEVTEDDDNEFEQDVSTLSNLKKKEKSKKGEKGEKEEKGKKESQEKAKKEEHRHKGKKSEKQEKGKGSKTKDQKKNKEQKEIKIEKKKERTKEKRKDKNKETLLTQNAYAFI